jgi:hypothetical protein
MPTVPYQKPTFHTSGTQKEPNRISIPPGPLAVFLEADFLVIGPSGGAPVSNGTLLATPAAVDASAITTGGGIAAGTYFVTTTYLNANGETTPGPVTEVTTTGATSTINVASPPINEDAIGYRLYVGTVLGTYHLQGATTAIGTAIALTAYSAAGAAPPTTNATGLAAPTIPAVAGGGTGGPAARTEYYTVTYVNENGETVASPEQTVVLTAGQLATVTSPAQSGDATGYNVYGALASGQEVKQNATPIAIGTNWTEPTTGLVSAGVQRAVTNQPAVGINGLPAILGLADNDYNAVYGGPVGGAQPGGLTPFGRPVWNQSRYGVTEVYPGGIGQEAKNAHVIAARSMDFEISFVQPWDPGYVFAQQVGLLIDPASGLFVADASQANKVANIVGSVDGPGRGGPGDTGKRVVIRFLLPAVALS